MTDTPYTPPRADLVTESNRLEPRFATLNIWRKIYLVIVWIVTVVFVLGAGLIIANPKQDDLLLATVVVTVLLLCHSYWTHWAVVNRRVGHLTAIAILNLFPGANIVGCLIMFAIRQVSVKEREQYTIENA